MSIPFSGQFTEQQFERFQQTCQPAFLKWLLKWFPWFWLGLTLIKIVGLPGYIKSAELVFDILFIFFFFFLSQFRKMNIKRIWQSNKLLKGQQSGTIDEEGIAWQNPYGESRYPWDVLVKFREVEDLILVYIASNQALIMPRSFFASEEEWNHFRHLLAKKLPEN